MAGDPGTTTRIVHGQGFTEVVIQRRGMLWRLLRMVLFAAAWLFGLLFGVVLMGAGAGDSPAWFLPVWLAGWGIGGLVVLFGMLWSAIGIETLIARSESLALVRRLLLFGPRVVLPAATIEDIRWVADNPARTVRVNGRRIPQTALEIVTGERVLRFADGIGEADAADAIRELRQRLVLKQRRQ